MSTTYRHISCLTPFLRWLGRDDEPRVTGPKWLVFDDGLAQWRPMHAQVDGMVRVKCPDCEQLVAVGGQKLCEA